MKTPDTTEARLDAFLSEFELDEQERILRYALDHIVPRLKSRAALASEAQGARSAEAPFDLETLKEQAGAWLMVAQTLHEVAPWWTEGASNGRDSACAAIRRLATHPAHPQVAAVVPQAQAEAGVVRESHIAELIAFAKTAPGRLPSRVQEAIAALSTPAPQAREPAEPVKLPALSTMKIVVRDAFMNGLAWHEANGNDATPHEYGPAADDFTTRWVESEYNPLNYPHECDHPNCGCEQGCAAQEANDRIGERLRDAAFDKLYAAPSQAEPAQPTEALVAAANRLLQEVRVQRGYAHSEQDQFLQDIEACAIAALKAEPAQPQGAGDEH